jgi:quercetin dioxygenase-like cupin family protein
MSTFGSIEELRPHLLRDGIQARAVNGERLTMAVIELEPDAVSPEHHHENEQLGFVIRGTLIMRIGLEKRELKPGDTYSVPSHVPHEAMAGPDGATVTDIFAPVRADWADLERAEPSPGRWP